MSTMAHDMKSKLTPILRWLAVGLLFAVSPACLAQVAETVTYYYTNQQGTPLATADAAGTILTTSDYRPYGSQVLGSPAGGPGYTGHVNDPDSGLVYMQARYYDPVVGRFLGVDPEEPAAENVFTFSRYPYAANNPVGNTDPNGRQTLPPSVYSIDWQKPETREAAAQYAVSLVPGYGLYSCATSGCSGTMWAFSGLTTALALAGGGGASGELSETGEVGQLANDVGQIHDVLDPIAAGKRTTAGMLTQDGKTLFAGGAQRDLSPAQRSVVDDLGGVWAKGKVGEHAEEKLLNGAEASGLSPKAMVASRSFCPACQDKITLSGGKLVDDRTAIW